MKRYPVPAHRISGFPTRFPDLDRSGPRAYQAPNHRASFVVEKREKGRYQTASAHERGWG